MSDAEFTSGKEGQRFLAALGRAITIWAELEDVLFKIVLDILGCTFERAAIVFYRTPSIDARLTLTADLVRTFFPRHEPGEHPDERIKQWENLEKQIRSHLRIRNSLAHHHAGPDALDYQLGDETERLEVEPSSYMSYSQSLTKRNPEKKTLLGITEICDHTTNVRKLTTEVRDFHKLHVGGTIFAHQATRTSPKPAD